jgi:serine/threonine kinase PknH
MTESASGSREGSQFGPYRLRRLLGRGGMGEVYEAEDTTKERVVALKLMNRELSSNMSFRERMQREAHTAGRLHEPHIVPIHDYGEIDGQLFIDMRFVQGADVKATLLRTGPLPAARAVALITQIASALDAAHSAGVIHRDVKPENVLVTDEDFAYLVDFGIAAAFTDQKLTATGTAVGSWNYMAPERFGNDETTYRADIYALACLLYECLTGTTPYRANSLPALMAAHITQPIPAPSRQNPYVPNAFDAVIACGMAKNPSDRYSSAGELARAAHHALSTPDQHRADTLLEHSLQAGPPPTAPIPWHQPPPQWATTRPPSRKPWFIMGAVALAAIVAIAGLAIWQSKPKAPDPHPNSRTTATSSTVPLIGPSQLEPILLSSAQVNSIMGATGMRDSAARPRTVLDNNPDTLSAPACLGSLLPAQASVYAGSGYTTVSYQAVQDPPNALEHTVGEAVVAFPSADPAAAFVTSLATKWRACSGQHTTEDQGSGQTVTFTFGTVVGDVPRIAQTNTLDGNSWACQHAVNAISNVILDVEACGYHINGQASQIMEAMTAKVPK